MNSIFLFLTVFLSISTALDIPKDVNYDLIDLKTGRYALEAEDSDMRNAFEHTAYTKTLMILYWQQTAEMEKRVRRNLKLKLTVKWMNCSAYDTNRLPMENYTVLEKTQLIHLLDFDCIPDEFRNWCAEESGRELHALYVLEKRFGVEMRFICDPKITKVQLENSHSWGYGVFAAILILFLAMIISKIRKRKAKNRKLKEIQNASKVSNNQIPQQNRRFLTVPLNYQPRREDSGRRMMEARKGFDVEKQKTRFSSFIAMPKMKRKIRIFKAKNTELPKIRIYGPED